MMTDEIFDRMGNRIFLCKCPEAFVDELQDEEINQVRKNMFIWTRFYICEKCEQTWTKEEYLMSNGESTFEITNPGGEEE